MKIVAHLKSGKCPKGSTEKRRGRSRRNLCVDRASLGMGARRKRRKYWTDRFRASPTPRGGR
jgi:hypothetical protein